MKIEQRHAALQIALTRLQQVFGPANSPVYSSATDLYTWQSVIRALSSELTATYARMTTSELQPGYYWINLVDNPGPMYCAYYRGHDQWLTIQGREHSSNVVVRSGMLEHDYEKVS